MEHELENTVERLRIALEMLDPILPDDANIMGKLDSFPRRNTNEVQQIMKIFQEQSGRAVNGSVYQVRGTFTFMAAKTEQKA